MGVGCGLGQGREGNPRHAYSAIVEAMPRGAKNVRYQGEANEREGKDGVGRVQGAYSRGQVRWWRRRRMRCG